MIDEKIIKISGKDYPVRKNARAYLTFQELTGHSISLYDSSTKDTVTFMYSCLVGGGLRCSFDDFLAIIDNEDFDDLTQKFANLVVNKTTEKKQKPR
jgi:hypothetical protein